MALYTRINTYFACAMPQTLSQLIKPYAIVAALCILASVGLHLWLPSALLFLDNLLTEHPILTGSWLALSAAGVDYAITTAYRKLRFAEVGAKSAAQLHISRS
ncbi:hypothetical protein CFB48_12465 [Burkholderia sp. AU33647]|uniref:hypothetical protein n=2 Tax=Burkholderiaceae TaxID=119060 RepID=UPI000B7A1EBE|nr:hypothetical protein [Burkholderia sp. HI4860]MCI3973121.1 hypothetical protein [Burkholderia sp. HI4860]OXJ05467.1 hypothetical protein CFB48_12465 [Burkholderia sp. AU33647]